MKKKLIPNTIQLSTEIRLDSKFNEVIQAMSYTAKYLYNEMLYASRQNYFNHIENEKADPEIKFENKFADFKSPDVYTYIKGSDHYNKLPNSIAQNSCLSVMQDMRSFFGSLKAKKIGNIVAKQVVNLPHYKKKHELFTLGFQSGNFKIYGNKVVFTTPKSITYFNTKEDKEITVISKEKITLQIPEYLLEKKISYIEINYQHGSYFAHISYLEDYDLAELDKDTYMSIDMGINNFATTLKSNGEVVIYNGKGMKSHNVFFNKVKARLTSNKDKSKCKTEKDAIQKQLHRIGQDRKGYIKTQIATIAHSIIEDAVENKVKTIVVGKNDSWKQECNMGKRNNQNFTNIPHARFIEVLEYLGKMRGISVKTVNESHTSKCDALAEEEIKHQETYLGKRIKRGLFKSSVKQVINADVNGAFNILRRYLNVSRKSVKYQKKIFNMILSSGCFQRPRVISL